MSMAALRRFAGKARAALPAGRDGTHQHAVADVVAGDARAELHDHPHRLMADDQPGLHRVLAAHNVQVCTADGCRCNAQQRFARSHRGFGHGLNTDVIDTVKHIGQHGFHDGAIIAVKPLPCSAALGQCCAGLVVRHALVAPGFRDVQGYLSKGGSSDFCHLGQLQDAIFTSFWNRLAIAPADDFGLNERPCTYLHCLP